MLDLWDDLPVHQSPATLDQPVTDDPRAYERYWFGFGALDGSAMVGLVVNVHPVLGLVDAAVSVSDGVRSSSVFASDVLRDGRQDLAAGPVRLTLSSPMRSLRIRVSGSDDAPDWEVDLAFTATTPAIAEDRVTRVRDDRVVQDRTRYVQLGTVAGSVRSPLGTMRLDEDTWRAGRDHSWGIWDAPTPGAPPRAPGHGPSFFWLIGAFDDAGVQLVTHAESDGTRYGEYAAVVPSLAAGADPAGPGARQQARPVTGIDVVRRRGTHHVETAALSVGGAAVGEDESFRVESMHAVLPRTVGYAHPTWVPGTVPPGRVRTESWTLADLDLQAPENRRSLEFARLVRPDGRVGWAFIDQSG